jgi:hypothetical protein
VDIALAIPLMAPEATSPPVVQPPLETGVKKFAPRMNRRLCTLRVFQLSRKPVPAA